MCFSLAQPKITKSRVGVVKANRALTVQVVNGLGFGIMLGGTIESKCSE